MNASEIRQDPTTKEWVIITKERAKRPQDFINPQAKPEPPAFVPSCPFCPGNEAMTPPETYRHPRSGAWQVRAVPNKFAALSYEGELQWRIEGLKRTISGVGVHEGIIESPIHNASPALMTDDLIEGGANALGETPVIQWRRDSPMGQGVLVDPAIDVVGGNASNDALFQHVQDIAGQLAAPADTLDLFLGLNDNVRWPRRSSPPRVSARVERRQILLEMTVLVLLSTTAPAEIIP